jgi:hypothetical protein
MRVKKMYWNRDAFLAFIHLFGAIVGYWGDAGTDGAYNLKNRSNTPVIGPFYEAIIFPSLGNFS